MSESKLVTLAIHTYEKAIVVKTILESQGIEVALQNVNLEHPRVASGVRVRIKESDLAAALRIVENQEIFHPHTGRGDTAAACVLVPVDFSGHSRVASEIAFDIARLLKAPISFLHAYLSPSEEPMNQLSDALDYNELNAEEAIRIERECGREMEAFVEPFRRDIIQGKLPTVKFNTRVAEGLAEECILDFTKAEKTAMIVMGTRGAQKKERQLLGSVTAEVLDSVRVPILTVPDSVTLEDFKNISDIVLFSNLEQPDLLAFDWYYRTMKERTFTVTIVHVPGRRERRGEYPQEGVDKVLAYCADRYPRAKFSIRHFQLATVIDDFNRLVAEQPVDLLVLPNKKRNMFARLFNPSIAHKLLFHADIPMIVIPV